MLAEPVKGDRFIFTILPSILLKKKNIEFFLYLKTNYSLKFKNIHLYIELLINYTYFKKHGANKWHFSINWCTTKNISCS